MSRPPTPISDRFSTKHRYNEETGCWDWKGKIGQNGYGVMFCGPGQATISAHRLSYELHVGSIPFGLEIDHLCRNRTCVNPDHLEAVTHAENMRRSELAACRRGHPFTEDNIYRSPSTGKRYCRTCKQDRKRAFDAKRRAA